MQRRLIVTHHAPDLDAIGAVWMLKRFDNQHYGTAHIAFVDPGQSITEQELQKLGFEPKEVTHVDTGFGEFDHHQPERGQQFICATSLTYDHVCQVHPEYAQDKALKVISDFVTEIDHFQEIHWPQADQFRYHFMIHELIKGMEYFDPHNDDSQLHFGLTCLDSAYGVLTNRIKAEEIIANDGIRFKIPAGDCLGVETSNDDVIKHAQRQGMALVVRKDPNLGNIRIKARPDAELDLKPLHEAILDSDTKGTWFYHPSGKMLLNGSVKHRNQTPSPLPLAEVVAMIREVYG